MWLSHGIFNEAANDENARVVLWHGAGDSFCAGNDIEDFLKIRRARQIATGRPHRMHWSTSTSRLVAAVRGAAIGGGTTMLTHCDFIYAGESTKFQMPFINLAVVPEFGSSCSVPARIGHVRAAELIFVGSSLRRQARRGGGSGYPGHFRQGRAGESDRNGREVGGEAGCGAASQQEAHEAAISRAD